MGISIFAVIGVLNTKSKKNINSHTIK